MKKANNLKIIALSLCMLASAPAWAGLGSLQVNSALGEPFSGSVVVTGDEARAALRGRPAVSGAPLQVRVTAQGKNAVIHLRSNKPVRDPILSFSLTAGSQGRQYTALLDPPAYRYDSADSGKEKGSGKATGKQRKLDKSAKSKSAARATTALQNGLASENAVVKYHVDNNETLMDVARKVRPQGLSVEQTMHALIVANPHAFRNDNPDFMYRDISLNIPSTSQLHKLSKIKIKTVQKTADTAQNTATQKPVKADADVVNTMASEAGDAAQTKVGEVKADTIPASAPVQVSAPAASAASVVKAAPVQPKVNHAEPPVQPLEESMLPAWWPYALAGVAGILLIAALLWQQRKKRHGAEEYEYEDDYSSDDEDDDVVINAEPPKPKVEQSVSVPATPAKTAEPTVAATAATAAATSTAADDDDWSWLNEVASDAQAEADAPAGGKVNQAAAVSPLSDTEAVADKQDEDDTDWLNFNFVDDTPAAPADTVVPTTTELDNNDDLSWLDQIDETEQPEILTAHESTDIAPQEEVDNTDLEWVVADEPQIKSHQEDVTAGQQSTSAASEVEMLNELANLEWDEDFKLDDEAKQDITPATEEVFSTLEPALISPEQHVFATEDDALSTDIDWEALDISDDDSTDQSASPATDSTPAAKVDTQDVSSMDFTLDDDKSESSATDNVVTATTTTPVSSFATGNGAQDWLEQTAESEPVDQPLTPEQQAVPLQAKLELAKMYLEMDDAVTARQTLRELVDEANGSILAEAQNLLQQLGG
ncbi:FimV/HubP family polar landmark protein [Snodgrassella communis]|nr:FimV/HubP family polar landmark protein [Snodgrassella communis]